MAFTPSEAVQRIARFSQRPPMRRQPGVIALTAGDPDFDTPDYIRRALIEAIEAGYTHYADGQGDPELRAALAEQVSRQAGAPYTPEQIQVTHGGSGALAASILAVVNPGDRVLLPEPTYSLYGDLVSFAGGQPVYVRQTADFRLDPDALRAAAPGAKLAILCHPCNPTGAVYTRAELDAFAAVAVEHDLLVLSDEAYDHLVYDGVEFVSTLAIEGLRDRLIYCQTFSKTYAMTGWRVGYVAAPAPIAMAAARVHRTFNGTMNAAVQRAALAAITTPSDWPERMRREYQARREMVLEYMAGAPGVEVRPPEGAFYAFVRCDTAPSSMAVVQAALERGVGIRSGAEYGPSGEGYVRLAYSTAREPLQEALLRLRDVFTDFATQSKN